MEQVRVYYVCELLGGDFDNIPISMFGQPALFSTRGAADRFCEFASAVRPHEVREWIPNQRLENQGYIPTDRRP